MKLPMIFINLKGKNSELRYKQERKWILHLKTSNGQITFLLETLTKIQLLLLSMLDQGSKLQRMTGTKEDKTQLTQQWKTDFYFNQIDIKKIELEMVLYMEIQIQKKLCMPRGLLEGDMLVELMSINYSANTINLTKDSQMLKIFMNKHKRLVSV